jgi:hypothetical protein
MSANSSERTPIDRHFDRVAGQAACDRRARRNGLERAREDMAGSVKSGWRQ